MTNPEIPYFQPDDAMRAAFERSVRHHLNPLHLLSLDRDPESGRYLDPAVFAAWWGYCTAAKASAIPAPEGAPDLRETFESWALNTSPDERTNWEVFQAGARAALAAQPREDSPAVLVCAQAYQVVGSMLSDLGQFETDRAAKILDNLSHARVMHDDVLPWPSFAAPAEGDDRVRPKLDASWIAAEDEAGGVAAAGALVAPLPDLAYSTDEENFSKDFCDVLDDLRNDHEDSELIGKTYWVGEKVEHPASHYFRRSAERVVEIAAELAYDENEHAEDFASDAPKEAVDELQAFIEAWADKHIKVNFWTVVNVRQLAITEEDLT